MNEEIYNYYNISFHFIMEKDIEDG
jgi:hypothetical protein